MKRGRKSKGGFEGKMVEGVLREKREKWLLENALGLN